MQQRLKWVNLEAQNAHFGVFVFFYVHFFVARRIMGSNIGLKFSLCSVDNLNVASIGCCLIFEDKKRGFLSCEIHLKSLSLHLFSSAFFFHLFDVFACANRFCLSSFCDFHQFFNVFVRVATT